VTPEQARDVVVAALKSAGTSGGAQLGPEQPGLLLIGGFQLSVADLDVLQAAADGLLQQNRSSRRHLIGVAFISIGIATTISHRPSSVLGPTGVLIRQEQTFQNMVPLRLAMNPHYDGAMQLVTEPPPRNV
jgi:hypothetical protein